MLYNNTGGVIPWRAIIATGRIDIQEQAITPPLPRRRRKLLIAVSALLLSAAAGGATGFFLRLDLPSVRRLEDYRPPLITRLLDARGEVLHQFAEERRILISPAEISPALRLAILAAEDPRFYQHVGVDPRAVVRAALRDLVTLSKEEGASTITQQLARNLFLVPRKLWRRKIQEALLAMEIERNYTKEEILGFYLNQIYLGHGRYGFEAAARYLFGRPAGELDLARAALLAGLAQRPEGLSPLRNPEAARRRRNHILRRMVIEGFVEEDEARRAMEEDLGLAAPEVPVSPAPFFVEEVRRRLEARYGETALYQEGLEVETTLDPELQAAANAAILRGLHALDRRIGWRGPEGNVLQEGLGDPEEVVLPGWDPPPVAGPGVQAVVLTTAAGVARVRVADAVGELGPRDVAWTGTRDPGRLLRRGDRIRVDVRGRTGNRIEVSLDQIPQVEGALVAIQPDTGEIRAMVGGYDFRRSQFNRATQAMRQVGSAFKPFVYLAAFYSGLTLGDVLLDEPTLFVDPQTGAGYLPRNYERDYNGIITLRHALEDSVNIATVRLLDRVGFDPVIRLAHRLGISSPLPPYPSLALGAAEMTLMEITSAYGAFPNQGVRVEPHLIRAVREHGGEIREAARPAATEAIRPDLASLMVAALEGVVQRGTGKGAQVLGRPVGGKTGTTDDYTDAWFVGFTPDLAVGVWVGFDQKTRLGHDETGARAALPIWIDFVEGATSGAPPRPFTRSGRLVQIPIDRRTGLRAGIDTGCRDVILEWFLEGTGPAGSCSELEHYRLGLPYFLQRFPLDEDRRLRLTVSQLDWLISHQGCRLEGGWVGPLRLYADYAGVTTVVEVVLVETPMAPEGPQELPEPPRLVQAPHVYLQDGLELPVSEEDGSSPPDPEAADTPHRWVGVDGKDAVVIFVGDPGAAARRWRIRTPAAW